MEIPKRIKPLCCQPEPCARLLSLDGGGIRGLFSLQIALRIEELLRLETGRQDLVLADWFHYIGGTSTGAIIASFLSWGLPVAEIERLYVENAGRIFSKAGWIDRISRHKFVSDGLTDFLRRFFTESDGSEANLGSSRLRTLLLIVCRNASTGSPWPVCNNPAALFNSPEDPGCNLRVPLWKLVRASTAAPTFFPPEILEFKTTDGGLRQFAFEDGGVTPFNNPSLMLFLMATDPAYRLGWQRGRERVSLVSIGTGRTRQGRGSELVANLLQQVQQLPSSLIDGFQQFQDLACRSFGHCVHGEPLDIEVGDMVRPTGGAGLFRYARYNKTFTSEEIQSLLLKRKGGFGMDNLELIDLLRTVGKDYAQSAVKLEHLL